MVAATAYGSLFISQRPPPRLTVQLLAPGPAEMGRGGLLVPDGVHDARALGLPLPAVAAPQVEVVPVDVPHAVIFVPIRPLGHPRPRRQPHQVLLDRTRRLDAEVVQPGPEVVHVDLAAV